MGTLGFCATGFAPVTARAEGIDPLQAFAWAGSGALTTVRFATFGLGLDEVRARAGLKEADVGLTFVGPANLWPPEEGGAKVFPRLKMAVLAPELGVNLPLPAKPATVVTVVPPG